jgi:hypothetical protein
MLRLAIQLQAEGKMAEILFLIGKVLSWVKFGLSILKVIHSFLHGIVLFLKLVDNVTAPNTKLAFA